MNITWVSPAMIAREGGGRMTSPLASVRLRLLHPLSYLNRPPFQHQVLTVTADTLRPEAFELMNSDVVVFGKTLIHGVHRELMERARSHNAHIVFDICDNYFEQTVFDEICRWSVAQASIVTCNSPAMQRVIQDTCGRASVVIPESYEGPRNQPKWAPEEGQLKLLWFGSAENFVFLENWIRAFVPFEGCPRLQIVVMTSANEQVAGTILSLQKDRRTAGSQQATQDITLIPVEWTLANLWRALKECDAVLIPSSPGTFTQTKSANRMVEALWAGKPVLATPLPSYRPFAEWTWQGTDMTDGLRWLLAEGPQTSARIEQAQAFIERTYAPRVVGTLWEQVLAGRREQAA